MSTTTLMTAPAAPHVTEDGQQMLSLPQASLRLGISLDLIRRRAERLRQAGLLQMVGHLRAVRVADLDRVREVLGVGAAAAAGSAA
jgi:hypothetical protein